MRRYWEPIGYSFQGRLGEGETRVSSGCRGVERASRIPTTRVGVRQLTESATVTVVITCYNYADYLSDAIESVLSQTGVDVDVVVVDDASSDASLLMAKRAAEQDDRVSVVANQWNLGPVGAFNRGLTCARGEFLVRLDADDLLTPGSLARAVAVFRACPDVGLVYGHPIHFQGDQRPEPRSHVKGWLVWKGMDWLAARCSDGNNVITSPEVVMRRSVVDEVGGMRELAHAHDMELWLRISARANVAYICGVDQAWHREHSKSLSTKADAFVIHREHRAMFEVLFSGLAPLTSEQRALQAQSLRAVALGAIGQAQSHVDRGDLSVDCRRLQEFALGVDPSVVETREWGRLERTIVAAKGAPPALAKVRGIYPRFRGRLRRMMRAHRWMRTGVYEPLSIESHGTG